MRVGNGRLFAKVGAEGYYCAGVRPEGIGIALKVEDGAKRAAEPAVVHVLQALGVIQHDLDALVPFANPAVTNTRNETVGTIRVALQ